MELCPPKMDFTVVREWIHECEKSHTNCRREILKPFEIILIDVFADCLVKKTTRELYSLASCVGRGMNPVQASIFRQPFEKLQSPGSLTNAYPPLFRDMIAASKELGVRYFYFEGLGGKLENSDAPSNLFVRGSLIYSQAFITFVAASATNLKDQLPRVPQIPHHYEGVDGTNYYSDVMAFRPSLHAVRSLIFTKHRVYFKCRETLKTDDPKGAREIEGESEVIKLLTDSQIAKVTLATRFEIYTGIVDKLSLWSMTFPIRLRDDPMQSFSQLLGSAFTAGLPDDLFEPALLWRRAIYAKPIPDDIRNPFFPSWSWLGWKVPTSWRVQSLQSPDLPYLNKTRPINLEEYRPLLRGRESLLLPINTNDSSLRQLHPSPIRTDGKVLKFHANYVGDSKFRVESNAERTLNSKDYQRPYSRVFTPGFPKSIQCGILYDCFDRHPWEDQGEVNMNWIALSCSDRTEIEDQLYKSWNDTMYNLGKWKFDKMCMIAVMLVRFQNCGSHFLAERVAIGLIHKEPWIAAGPELGEFWLQ